MMTRSTADSLGCCVTALVVMGGVRFTVLVLLWLVGLGEELPTRELIPGILAAMIVAGMFWARARCSWAEALHFRRLCGCGRSAGTGARETPCRSTDTTVPPASDKPV